MTFFSLYPGCRVIDNNLAFTSQVMQSPIPLIKKQNVSLNFLSYLGFQNSRKVDNLNPKDKTIGFFLEDSKFRAVCNRPWNYVNWIKQYKQVMSPDISCYRDMNYEDQRISIFHNRLIAAYWQSQGLIVIPTVSWGDSTTFEFCFEGIEKGSVVAISTIGTKNDYWHFIDGFKEMCQRINPTTVLCYCNPYLEMYQHVPIISIEHEGTKAKRLAKLRPSTGQLSLF